MSPFGSLSFYLLDFFKIDLNQIVMLVFPEVDFSWLMYNASKFWFFLCLFNLFYLHTVYEIKIT